MQDIALSVGAKYFSEKTGDDLSLITLSDLGHADKVISGKSQTVIIKDNQMTEDIEKRIEDLKEQQENTEIVSDREFINERIASLSGSIGAIYVGGNSDVEQKEKYDRIEDAVCAVRSALEEGIVAGGGTTLYKVATYIEDLNNGVAGKILASALRAPLLQIYANAGIELHKKAKEKLMHDEGYEGLNIKTEKWGDMYKMGVIDPLKVTKSAFLNAVSVATTILTTNVIITHARAKE